MLQQIANRSVSGPLVVENMRGEVDFVGYANIIEGRNGDVNSALIGDATITVDFSGPSSISGSATNFGGATRGNNGAGTAGPYSGTLILGNGAIVNRNEIVLDYRGTLIGNGDRLTLNGTLDGDLQGNPRVLSIGGIDTNGNATLNGQPTSATVIVFGEAN